jgi:hypothetical protein
VGGFVPVDAQKQDKNVEFGESWFMRKKKWRNGGDGNERRAGGSDGRRRGDVWWMARGVVVVKWLVGEVGYVGKDRKMGRGCTA